jgi:hypothetical protein
MLNHPNSTTNPNANPHAPFPSDQVRSLADAAATALIDRYTLAKRAMESLADDADNATALAAFNELANVSCDLHRLLMLGWWADQPF